MPTWIIRLFGREELRHSGKGSLELPDIWWPVFGSLLSAQRHLLSRGKLAGMLWPDKPEKAARHCLATALWRIKTRFPSDHQLITFDSNTVALCLQGSFWVDLVAFERRTKLYLAEPQRLASHPERERLRRALAHYRDPFMAERDVEWIAIERERLRTLYLDAMFALASAEVEAERWTDARDSARRICAVEPLREDAQRLLMLAHVKCGARAVALDQYNVLADLLRSELGIAPMAQTQQLAAEIAGQNATDVPKQIRLASPAPSQSDARLTMLRVRDHLNRSLDLLNGYLAD